MGMLGDHYLLVGGEVIPCGLMEWAQWFERNEERIIAQDHVDGYFCSTVFLGLDHGFPRNPEAPLVFETMIFEEGKWSELYCDRYSTLLQAQAGHTIALGKIADGSIDEERDRQARERNKDEHEVQS